MVEPQRQMPVRQVRLKPQRFLCLLPRLLRLLRPAPDIPVGLHLRIAKASARERKRGVDLNRPPVEAFGNCPLVRFGLESIGVLESSEVEVIRFRALRRPATELLFL